MLLSITLTAFATLATCRRHDVRSLEERQAGIEASDYHGHMVPSFNISMPVDHFNDSDTRMYNNRYWINDTYYKPGGPVFFLDNGESGISEYDAAEWLAEINVASSVMVLARRYNGLAVMWEDRYYGKSLPVPFNNTQTVVKPVNDPQGWDYLTIEQALADVLYFAQNMATGGYQRDNMTALAPPNTPWIWVGGSYPGARGAWARIKCPEVIYATWASSASLLKARYDGSAYYYATEGSLPSNCSTDLRAMVAYIDGILAGDPTSQTYIDVQMYMYMTEVVGLAYYTSNTPGVYTYNLSDAQSYDATSIGEAMLTALYANGLNQVYGPVLTTQIFCNYFESFNSAAQGNVANNKYISAATNPGNAQPAAEGIIASHNGNMTVGLEALTYALAQFQNYLLTTQCRTREISESSSNKTFLYVP